MITRTIARAKETPIAKQQVGKFAKAIIPAALTLTAGICGAFSQKSTENEITIRYNRPPEKFLPNTKLANDIKTNNPFEKNKIENPYQLNYLA